VISSGTLTGSTHVFSEIMKIWNKRLSGDNRSGENEEVLMGVADTTWGSRAGYETKVSIMKTATLCGFSNWHTYLAEKLIPIGLSCSLDR